MAITIWYHVVEVGVSDFISSAQGSTRVNACTGKLLLHISMLPSLAHLYTFIGLGRQINFRLYLELD